MQYQCIKSILLLLIFICNVQIGYCSNSTDDDLFDYFEERRNEWISSKWEGTLGNGTIISASGLMKIVNDHLKWLASNKLSGKRANLSNAKIRGAYLYQANLAWAVLKNVDLSNSDLSNAVLIRADFSGATLTDTSFMFASMSSVDFQNANLSNANFEDADLSGSNFSNADLTKANLRNAKLEDVQLENTNLFKTLGLAEQRTKFKTRGNGNLVKQLTYEINKTKRIESWEKGFLGKLDSLFRYIMFELTSLYGYAPIRCIVTLLVLIPVFAVLYFSIVLFNGKDGIWIVWDEKRMRQDIGSNTPLKIQWKLPNTLFVCVYFSVLSAFHIGWNNLTIRNWLARLQLKEYSLSATGWARTLSGLQSIISLYLLVLWILTYFQNPFE